MTIVKQALDAVVATGLLADRTHAAHGATTMLIQLDSRPIRAPSMWRHFLVAHSLRERKGKKTKLRNMTETMV
jgi:hypothetical protein